MAITRYQSFMSGPLPAEEGEWVASKDMRKWLREEATRLLGESPQAHPDVLARWKVLAEEEDSLSSNGHNG